MLKVNKLFLLKDTATLPISNDQVEIETNKGSYIAHISLFDTSDPDEMAWQIRDIVEKEYKDKITDMASLKVLTTDFCARFPIVQEIFSDLDSEK